MNSTAKRTRRKAHNKALKLKATTNKILVNRAERMLNAGNIENVPGSLVVAVRTKGFGKQFDAYRASLRIGGSPYNQRQKRKYARQSGIPL